MPPFEPVIDRWRKHSDRRDGPGACWPWMAYRTERGYGKMGVGSQKLGTKRSEYAHRIAYRLFVGPIADGMVIRHRCDHPWCVNPQHLEIGTHADNMRDCIERGRYSPPPKHAGETHPRAKLNMRTAICLRDDVRSKRHTYASAAIAYGVSEATVWRVMSGESWNV